MVSRNPSHMHRLGTSAALADNFIQVMRGETPPAGSLKGGLLSALMCLKARESARTDACCGIREGDGLRKMDGI